MLNMQESLVCGDPAHLNVKGEEKVAKDASTSAPVQVAPTTQ